jgi:hypothetical protein
VHRMQGLPEQINGEAGILQRGKQPRPLEDGNWVCDDPSCSNVNYPRRTEVDPVTCIQSKPIFSHLMRLQAKEGFFWLKPKA